MARPPLLGSGVVLGASRQRRNDASVPENSPGGLRYLVTTAILAYNPCCTPPARHVSARHGLGSAPPLAFDPIAAIRDYPPRRPATCLPALGLSCRGSLFACKKVRPDLKTGARAARGAAAAARSGTRLCQEPRDPRRGRPNSPGSTRRPLSLHWARSSSMCARNRARTSSP